MRVNIYAEELLIEDVKLVTKPRHDGGTFKAIRFYLDSTPRLHYRPDDDDRSAVSFWGSRSQLRTLFENALEELKKIT